MIALLLCWAAFLLASLGLVLFWLAGARLARRESSCWCNEVYVCTNHTSDDSGIPLPSRGL